MQTKLLLSSSYHPQTDGQIEHVNQCLDMYVHCAVHHSPRKWKSWLPLAEIWYNSTFHTSLGCSPFKALYGYDAQLGTMLPMLDGEQSPAPKLLQDRENHLSLLNNHLAAAQNRMKLQADCQRTKRQQVGDQVLVKL